MFRRKAEDSAWPAPDDLSHNELWRHVYNGTVDIPKAIQALRNIHERIERLERAMSRDGGPR